MSTEEEKISRETVQAKPTNTVDDLSPTNAKCIFCRIAHNKEPNSRVLHSHDGVVIFEDIHPAAKHHYLVIPKAHVQNPKHLGPDHISLVESLVHVGKEYLANVGGDVKDARLGFHWPPFNSIDHLHLHIISPSGNMSLLKRAIFKENSFWFVSVDYVLNRLRKMSSTSV